MYIVETVAVVKPAGAYHIVLGDILLGDILLGDVDKEPCGVAIRSRAAARFGGDGQGGREDASFMVDMGHGVEDAGGAIAEIP